MVSLENQDLRDILYSLLKETTELQGATDVLENNNNLTKEEIEKELEKRIEEAKKELPIVGQTEEVVRDQNGGLQEVVMAYKFIQLYNKDDVQVYPTKGPNCYISTNNNKLLTGINLLLLQPQDKIKMLRLLSK